MCLSCEEKRPIFSCVSFLKIYFLNACSSVSSASDYVRHVFSIVPAILALAGSLMVLVLQSSSLCCSTVREGWYQF